MASFSGCELECALSSRHSQPGAVMLRLTVASASMLFASVLAPHRPSRRPADALVSTEVIPHATPVIQVVGVTRDFAGALGVRCQFCHVGEEGMPLELFDFANDEKRTKLVARQMMRMVQEINRRLDTLPGRAT